MKVIIVEDEYPALERIKSLIDTSPVPLEIIGEAATGERAIELINRLRPEAIFLDIQLLDMTGFDVLSSLTHNPFIIFTTAYDQYALKAFEFHSIDYLVKPIFEERFNRAVQKLADMKGKTSADSLEMIRDWMKTFKKQEKHTFPIKNKDSVILLDFDDIAYFKAEDKYVTVALGNGTQHLVNTPINQLESELPGAFTRIHRSYIVNRNFVYELKKYFKGRFVLKLNDKARNTITSSSTYTSEIKKAFGI